MKILFIIPGLAIGGQEKAGMLLTNALNKNHDVLVVCFEKESESDFDYQSEKVRVLNTVYKSVFLKSFAVVKRSITIRKIKRKFKPDVSISFGETAIVANALTLTKEIKIAVLHQSIRFINTNNFVYRNAYKQHDLIVPVSNGINHELKNILNIRNNLYIHNGVELEEIKLKSEIDLDKNIKTFFNGNVLVHMGRFDIPKGHWHLVILYVIAKKKNPDLKLLMIGDYFLDNEIFMFCQNYLAINNLKIVYLDTNDNKTDFKNADVLFTGNLKNPFNFLKSSDIFIFPSIWEGFGNALVEAMACGLPIITADCPTGPREILGTEGKNGILLKSFSLDFEKDYHKKPDLHFIWADVVNELLKDKKKLAHFKKQSINRSREFGIENYILKWNKLLEKILDPFVINSENKSQLPIG
jgi:glycosyltransferase involved in cell wall biosynthesis